MDRALFDPSAYAYNPWALPYLVSAMVLLGLALYHRRRARELDLAFVVSLLPIWLDYLVVVCWCSARVPEVALAWARLSLALTAFIGPVTLHFVTVLVGWRRQLRLTRAGFVLAAAAFGILTIATDLVLPAPWHSRYGWFARAGALFPLYTLVVGAAGMAAVGILLWHLRGLSPGPARRRESYVLFGYAMALLGFTDFLPFWQIEVTPSSYVPIVCGVLVIHRAIRGERLRDLATVGTRTLAWAAVSMLVLVPLLGLAWLSRGWAGWHQPLVAALALYAVVLLLRAYLLRVQPRIDHWFQRRGHDLAQAADRFAARLAVLHTAADLGRVLGQVVEESLYCRLCAFVVADVPDEAAATSEDSFLRPGWQVVASVWGRVPAPHPDDPVLEALHDAPRVLTRLSLAQGVLGELGPAAERLLVRYGAEALLVLGGRPHGPLDAGRGEPRPGPRALSGLVFLGPRPGGRPLAELELDFLEKLRTHAAAALVQARLYDRLHRLKLELEEKVAARTAELARAAQNLRSAHEQLVQSEKMSLLGLLASGVAEELLGAVERARAAVPELVEELAALESWLESARQAAGPEARAGVRPLEETLRLDFVRRDLGALVEAIAEGARRAAGIAEDLGRFAHADAATRQVHDLHAGLESTLRLLRPELDGGRVVLERDFDPEVPPLECDPGPLHQVFLNLLLNAAQAIEERGTITIRTRRVDPDRIEVSVRDTGKGIPREHLGRIFEPFFTTKPTGKPTGGGGGTGLGLAVSYGIVERHGGRIFVASEEGKGTEFRVVLPIRQPEGLRPRPGA